MGWLVAWYDLPLDFVLTAGRAGSANYYRGL